MAHKERIDYLLLDIRELEKKIAGMRDAEIYPISFFSQSFELAHKILTDLHRLEAVQLEDLSRQMEEHRLRLSAIPLQEATKQPERKEETMKIETLEEEITTQEEEPEISSELMEATKKNVDETDKTDTFEVYQEIETDKEPIPAMIPDIKIKEEIKSNPKEIPLGEIKTSVSFNEILEKKNLSDFRKAFSLNDRFRFRRELFGGDENRMNQAITDLNNIQTYEESVTYLHVELNWNVEDEAVADFLKLIEKRFL